MKITQTRVALAVLVAAGISVAVWRMTPPAATTAATAEAPTRGAQPVPGATAPPLPPPLASDRDDSPATGAAPSVGRAFWYAKDYYTFLHDYAPAAYAGDGRAAYYLWEATLRCYLTLKLEDMALPPPPYPPPFPDPDHERCARLRSEDPFADLPPYEGGYTWRYWKERAIAANDPIALLLLGMESSATAEERRAGLAAAARSRDPEVFFVLGLALPAFGTGFEESVGWQLAACKLGYDCRVDNPRVGMGCLEWATCTAGETVASRLRDDESGLGFMALERAQARADVIVAEFKAGRVPRVEVKLEAAAAHEVED